MHQPRHSRHLVRAFSTSDLFWTLFFLALLITVLLPSCSRARGPARRSICASNLRGIGQGMHIYANDNREWFPHHYFNPLSPEESPEEHGVAWVGTMGSNEFLRISQATTPTISPRKSHPSRSLYMLVIGCQLTTGSFICPSTNDIEDDSRNYGPDAADGQSSARPGKNRYDFRGYDHLSYGYQLPYGRQGRPRDNMDSRMALVADKGPYYASGGPGLDGTRTIRDQRSDVDVPTEWGKQSPAKIDKLSNEDWRKYNSRNHGGEGQNVLYVDGHADFQRKPLVGVNHDNLYTIQSGYTTADGMIGRVPHADQALGPLTNTDSFLVP